MTEKLLHYIWQCGYFNQAHLTTIAGEAVRIISRGTLNKNQGPDFLSAMVSIGNTVLAGSIELHIKTSDWDRHQHTGDENYNNVILHVVYQHDTEIDHFIPVLELQPHISSVLLHRYESLMQAADTIACGNEASLVNALTWASWKERLLVERLQRRSASVFELLNETNGSWEEVAWWMIARNFGIVVNADAFEAVARSLPLRIITRHRQSIHQVEALLFGQANLLGVDFNEDYPKLLKREYQFLKKKYGLVPAFAPVLFLRMRPANFPTVRLAQLAMVLHTCSHIFSRMIEETDLQKIKQQLEVQANDYWHYHYRFDELGTFKPKKTGDMIVQNILINTIIPLVFAYGLYHKNEPLRQKALDWLQHLNKEDNRITGLFRTLSIPVQNAFDSQALVELKTQYCDAKRCLECAVGSSILNPPIS